MDKKTSTLIVLITIMMMVMSGCATRYTQEEVSQTLTPAAATVAAQARGTEGAAAWATQEPLLSTPNPTKVELRPTFKFHYPDATSISGQGWSIEGLPSKPAEGTVLTAQGMFKNTLGLGTESWLAEPGTLLVGPEFPGSKVEAAKGAIEYQNPINQQLITMAGQAVPVTEGRFQWCTAGGFRGEVNGVAVNLEYQEGHVWFLIIRGLFADGLQDSDRNHTLLLTELAPGHVQCMSYPGNGGGFISEENYEQVAAFAHGHRNCGAEGCSQLDAMFIDLNTGAFTLVHQDQLDAPWEWVASNWWQPNPTQ